MGFTQVFDEAIRSLDVHGHPVIRYVKFHQGADVRTNFA